MSKVEKSKKRKLSKRALANPHYVNNKEFTAAVAAWVEENIKIHGKDKKLRPQWSPFSNYIGECIIKIVTHYALKPRWRGYTYIDEMKSEAILTCVKYAHNFNIKKSNNAFAYFTQITEFSFRQVWNVEDKQSYVKYHDINEDSAHSLDKFSLFDEDADKECRNQYEPDIEEDDEIDTDTESDPVSALNMNMSPLDDGWFDE